MHARAVNKPIVALETTVLTHGLPYPENIELALKMEAEIRKQGAVPATIGILNGRVCIGMSESQMRSLVAVPELWKVSSRDFANVIANKASGGTTVAGTLVAAQTVGIKVFATGGIGGVHRDIAFDVSADLLELSRRQLLVVCAGAKAILDLSATLEYLETMGVPVVGFKTYQFPAFYSIESGYKLSTAVNSPEDAAKLANLHWRMGLSSSILVVVPPPREVALSRESVTSAINQALNEANQKNIRGQQVTPFLLKRVSELTGKASLKANLGLLINNAALASKIAVAMKPSPISRIA
jgi:pseudouridine-5'-phosphate glycosidase